LRCSGANSNLPKTALERFWAALLTCEPFSLREAVVCVLILRSKLPPSRALPAALSALPLGAQGAADLASQLAQQHSPPHVTWSPSNTS
jgi:hypothetical protein